MLFYAPDIEDTLQLPPDEAQHALKVLRLQKGAALEITDGRGTLYNAALQDTRTGAVAILSSTKCKEERHITLAIAPTKNRERMEWLVEKATEIGISEIALLDTAHSERHHYDVSRLNRVAIAALKQSHKAYLPRIQKLTSFADFISGDHEGCLYIAHVRDDCGHRQEAVAAIQAADKDTAVVLIGPEGDFSRDEVEAAIARGYAPVSLGNQVLRTETAALVAIVLLNLIPKNE